MLFLLAKTDLDLALEGIFCQRGDLLFVLDHVRALGTLARKVNGVKRTLGGAQAATNTLVGVDNRGAAAQAASGLGAHLLFGKRLRVLAEGQPQRP